MRGETIDHGELRRARITERDLWIALRHKGLHSVNQVAAVILEPNGSLTLLRTGERVDRRLLMGVRGAGDLPESFFLPDSPEETR